MMTRNINLPFLITALAAVLGFSMCCPIGCLSLPEDTITYIKTALERRTPLQATVNVTTTRGYNFRPQTISYEIGRADEQQEVSGCPYNFTSSDTGVETPCPWSYQCDFDPQRIPAFIFHAHCDSATPQGDVMHGFCDEVYYPVNYIKTESCDPLGNSDGVEWKLDSKIIPVSCNLQVAE